MDQKSNFKKVEYQSKAEEYLEEEKNIMRERLLRQGLFLLIALVMIFLFIIIAIR